MHGLHKCPSPGENYIHSLSSWQAQDICMNIDNQAICHCVNNGKLKDPQIMALISFYFFMLRRYDATGQFDVTIVRIDAMTVSNLTLCK